VVEVDPRIGSEIAGYRIEAVMGRVQTGVVYLARDVRANRPVLLHLLSEGLAGDGAFRERFLREAKLAASLDHPGILAVHEAGEANGHLYLATGHLEGTDLASLLAGNGGLAPERTLAIVAQLAAALDHARFARGLVHGHLDPGDVLLTRAADGVPGEQVRLRGFGLRRELPPGAAASEAVQRLDTIDYLAPEQLEGKQVTPRSDVYALGCLFYHCLTGEPPFTGQPADVVRAHLHEPPPSATRRRPELPSAVNEVIRTALAKWPEERYPTCAELAAAARAALTAGKKELAPSPGTDRPSSAVVPPRLEPATREEQAPPPATDGVPAGASRSWARRLGARRRTAITAASVAVLFTVLAAVVVWRTGDDMRDPGAATPTAPAAAAPGGAASADGLSGPATAGQAQDELASADRDLPAPEPQPPAAAAATSGPDPPAAPEPDSQEALDQLVSFGSGSLVRIDGDGGEVAARVAIPAPALVAADDESVWVLTERGSGGRQLVRVEQATSAVAEVFAAVAPPDAGFDESPGLAAVGGDAFVGLSRGLYRFTPGRGAGEPLPIDTFGDGNLGNDRTLWPVAAAGSLWVRGGQSGAIRLLRLDPATGNVLDHLGSFDRVVAAGSDFVWAQGPEDSDAFDLLLRIDTATGEAKPLRRLPGWRDFVAAGGAVWASSSRHDAILRLDPHTGEEIERIALAGTPGALAAGGGAVWAALPQERAVARYDLASGRLTTIDVAGVPVDLAFAAGSLWVGVNDPSVETRIVNGVRFSFAAPLGWERGPTRLAPDGDDFTQGQLLVSKWTSGGQDAEGVVFWTGFPTGAGASACGALQDRDIGPSIADLTAAVAAAPGTQLISGPSDVTVGGHPATYVELTVREDLGCDPGYFYTWDTRDWVGAGWLETTNGYTIRVWIVDVDGTRLFIEAETKGGTGFDLEPEIHQIVDSIRFETPPPG
jgi:serine/threonine-protein kinase